MNINAPTVDPFYRRYDTFAGRDMRRRVKEKKREARAPPAADACSSSVWLDVSLTKVMFTLSIHTARIHSRARSLDCATACRRRRKKDRWVNRWMDGFICKEIRERE